MGNAKYIDCPYDSLKFPRDYNIFTSMIVHPCTIRRFRAIYMQKSIILSTARTVWTLFLNKKIDVIITRGAHGGRVDKNMYSLYSYGLAV